MIVIPRALIKEIESAAEAAYPEESCGLLIGHGSLENELVVLRIAVSDNVAESDKRRSFEVNPKLRFDLMRELGDGPTRIVGHFHSHTRHGAKPSERDRDQVWEPELVWLITAVVDGRSKETAAYAFDTSQKEFRKLVMRYHD